VIGTALVNEDPAIIIAIPHWFVTDQQLRAGVRFPHLPIRWLGAASQAEVASPSPQQW
jgi:hypothetical protein